MSPEEYQPAFQLLEEPFLFAYGLDDRGNRRQAWTRGEFLSLSRRAAGWLSDSGCRTGARVLHCFGENDAFDLVFRFGAAMIGAIPVTVNWQADPFERILYKFKSTGPSAVVFGSAFDPELLQRLREASLATPFLDSAAVGKAPEIPYSRREALSAPDLPRMVIFTSGTTGNPKGVMLTSRNYDTNEKTYEKMLDIRETDRLALLIVNPLHHSNSTAMCDLALRRPGTHLHLLSRYGTAYWEILTEVAESGYDRVVAPTVSRHFDFFDELAAARRLPLPLDRLKKGMSKIDFLIGSAPVGPKTIERLKTYTGRIPLVRFGSTETCLQVLGIPHCMAEEMRLHNFTRGWNHNLNGEAISGYYIGRPHPPHTYVRIVKSIDRKSDGYMKDVPPGVPGYLITKGGNLMQGYVNDPSATEAAFEGEWYLGLKDICFALENDRDGELDFYWMSRDSSLLIRGGANYSCEQIGAELSDFIEKEYRLPRESFDVAVVGLKVASEHEDSCCVTIELKDEKAQFLRENMEKTFMRLAREHVSKGSRPDYARFAEIPRNFKGAVLVPELKKAFEVFLLDPEKALRKV